MVVGRRGGKPNWQFLTCENEWLGKRRRGEKQQRKSPSFRNDRKDAKRRFFSPRIFFAKRSKRQNPQFANLLRRAAVQTRLLSPSWFENRDVSSSFSFLSIHPAYFFKSFGQLADRRGRRRGPHILFPQVPECMRELLLADKHRPSAAQVCAFFIGNARVGIAPGWAGKFP